MSGLQDKTGVEIDRKEEPGKISSIIRFLGAEPVFLDSKGQMRVSKTLVLTTEYDAKTEREESEEFRPISVTLGLPIANEEDPKLTNDYTGATIDPKELHGTIEKRIKNTYKSGIKIFSKEFRL